MAGHSKWAGIKHKKAIVDAQRGKLFSKLIRELTVAAKQGGGHPEANPRLRLAIAKAREANMPKDTIEKAILRGTGQLPGVTYEEVVYEGYGPGGVAILVEAVTDNKNRTTQEIRTTFAHRGGNLAGAGSVSWLFHKKGLVAVPKQGIDEDRLMSIVLEAGAEDLRTQSTAYEITTDPKSFERVRQALESREVPIESAELTMLPTSQIKLVDQQARHILELVDAIEELEDVQHVYANFDIPDEIIEQVAKQSQT